MKTAKTHALCLGVLVLWFFGGGAVVPPTAWGLGLLAGLAAYGWLVWRQLRARFYLPGGKITGYPENQARWLKQVRKTWPDAMEAVGLTVSMADRKRPDVTHTYYPQLRAHEPVPVGVQLTVQPSAGHQSVEQVLAAKGKLETRWGVPLRLAQTGPATLTITAEFGSPLEDSRDAGDDWMGSRDAL